VGACDNLRISRHRRGMAGNILAAVYIVKNGWISLDYSLDTAEQLAKNSLVDCMVNHYSSNWFVEKPADKLEGWTTNLKNCPNESQYRTHPPAGFTSLKP
jgi:hypothetical protein